MKKIVLVLMLLLAVILTLSACGFDDAKVTTTTSTSPSHTLSDWIIDKEATCIENGSKHKECTVCHETLEKATIKATGHTCGKWIHKVDATCASTGTLGHYHCSICEKDLDIDKNEFYSIVIPLKDHSYKNGKCTGCEKAQPDSEGLEFTLSSDGTYYSVSGIGTCTDANVIIPSKFNELPVKEIDRYAFLECIGLKSIMIPDSVTSIGECAFQNCTGLKSITIPDSVTSIGNKAFKACNSLEYNEDDDAYYLGNADNPYLVFVRVKDTSITSCSINNSTKLICYLAFPACKELTSITIPDSVTSIGERAFFYCTGLTGVTIPDSVTSIGGYAFYYCTGLKSIMIPDSVTSIGYYAFSGCTGLTSVTIPDSVTYIGNYAFYYCTGLKTINYAGTEEQWKAIRKDSNWDESTGYYTLNYNYKGN